ncbi:MAG: hypothetical protein EAZ18_22630 [Oscillatoriales cyanobacterium]|nr:MAG: hypothetical protein EAZ18_22630 [Oscillatoriales cyanobacterium]
MRHSGGGFVQLTYTESSQDLCTPTKKPGFWPHLRITTKNSRKNPVSGHPRLLKETGFLAASTHHNQEFSKKPGFWPFAPPQKPRILEKTRFLTPA